MYFKLKKKYNPRQVYFGKDGLNIPKGTVVEVIGGYNIGNIIVRTDNDKHPFITLKSKRAEDKALWGNMLSSYTFQVIPDAKESDF